ncbi:hypothetical protein ABZ070_30220 [Streptomyces sp. NPDC006283]|uniref:hypothetical protein n=1 Tax=Streptomyces sp. NPDC006283 TaxID=3156741 RepID=UPI0033BE90DA
MTRGTLSSAWASSYHGGDPRQRIAHFGPIGVIHVTTRHPHRHFTDKELRP